MQICEHCCTGEKDGVLTPIHLTIGATTLTIYFHNRHRNDCLALWLSEQRRKFLLNPSGKP